MSSMLPNLEDLINRICSNGPINALWCGIAARITGLKLHKDAKLIPYVLARALIELFLSTGVQQGSPNSFKVGLIYHYYEVNLDRENGKRKKQGKTLLPSLTKEGLLYYLKKKGFALFAERLSDRVEKHVKTILCSCNMLIEGQLLLESFNLLLNHPIEDLISNDGCYKVVDGRLEKVFKGGRTAKKDIVNPDGSISKPKNAQLGQQTAFSIPQQIPVKISLSSGTANERDYLDIQPNTIHVNDAGYLDFSLFDKFDQQGAYLVVKGKRNMVGNLFNIKIDGVDCTQDFSLGGSIKSPKIQSIPVGKVVEMTVLVSYDKGRKAREVRVVRCEDVREKGKAAFIVTNLPASVPASVVLDIMRLRWCIELFFKALKSYTRYRAGQTSSEPLTVGLTYFSIIAHLLREAFLQVIERYTRTSLSLKKVCDYLVNQSGESVSLSLLMGKLMMGGYDFDEQLLTKAKTSVLEVVNGEDFNSLKKSVQSKKNKFRSFDFRVASIVRAAIEANPFGKDVQNLREELNSFVYDRGIAKVVNPL